MVRHPSVLPPRRVLALVLSSVGVIGAGLTVHVLGRRAAADFAADALYAALACLLVFLFWPRGEPMRGAILAFLACTAVELAQLTGGPAALAAVFPPARLLLGTTFTAIDLVAYAVGVAAVYAVDRISRRRPARRLGWGGCPMTAPAEPQEKPPASPPTGPQRPAETGVAPPHGLAILAA